MAKNPANQLEKKLDRLEEERRKVKKALLKAEEALEGMEDRYARRAARTGSSAAERVAQQQREAR